MGAHRGTTSDVPGAASKVGLWLAPGVEGVLAWGWARRIALELRAGAWFPLRRTRFFLAPDSTVYEVPVVAGNIDLGLRIEFL